MAVRTRLWIGSFWVGSMGEGGCSEGSCFLLPVGLALPPLPLRPGVSMRPGRSLPLASNIQGRWM